MSDMLLFLAILEADAVKPAASTSQVASSFSMQLRTLHLSSHDIQSPSISHDLDDRAADQ
jgi:hypothetical protein